MPTSTRRGGKDVAADDEELEDVDNLVAAQEGVDAFNIDSDVHGETVGGGDTSFDDPPADGKPSGSSRPRRTSASGVKEAVAAARGPQHKRKGEILRPCPQLVASFSCLPRSRVVVASQGRCLFQI